MKNTDSRNKDISGLQNSLGTKPLSAADFFQNAFNAQSSNISSVSISTQNTNQALNIPNKQTTNNVQTHNIKPINKSESNSWNILDIPDFLKK